MKTVRNLIIVVALATGLSACVVRERGGVYERGHYETGPYGGRHWVPAHHVE